MDHTAGAVMYVTFLAGGLRLPRGGGARRDRVDVFIAMLGVSGLLYVAAAAGQTLDAWLNLHRSAIAFYGGVTRALVPGFGDPRPGQTCWRDDAIVAEYRDLAAAYGSRIMPLVAFGDGARHAIQASVDLVRRWETFPVRETPSTLDEISAHLALQAMAANQAPIPGLGMSRRRIYEEIERPALLPLLTAVPDLDLSKRNFGKVGEYG